MLLYYRDMWLHVAAGLLLTTRTHISDETSSGNMMRNINNTFNVYGSVHHRYIPIYIQQDATLNSLFISGNCSTCFGWYFHPSSGAHTTGCTAPDICHTVTATCRYGQKIAKQSTQCYCITEICGYTLQPAFFWQQGRTHRIKPAPEK